MRKITLGLMVLLVLMVVPTIILGTELTDAEYVVEVLGGSKYSTLPEAIESVNKDGKEITIKLLKDVDDATGFVISEGQNIVIDFGGFYYDASNPLVGSTGTETLGCQLLKGSTVTLKNGKLISKKAKMLLQNYSDLTLDNMTIDGTKSEVMSYVVSNNCGNVEIINGTSIKAAEGCIAMDMCWAPQWYPEGTQITVNTTGTIIGDIELGTWGDVDESKPVKSNLAIKNVNHNGNIKRTKEFLKEKCVITGGIFTSNISTYVEEGLEVKEEGDKYIIKEIISEPEVVPTPEPEVVPTPEPEVLPTPEPEEIQEVELPKEVEFTKEVEENLLASLKELAKDNKELADFIENNDVEIKVELSEKEVEKIEKENIEKAIEKEVKGIKIAKYLDITIVVNNSTTNEKLDTISELKNEITFTVAVPEDLPEVEEGYTRNYYIIRNHEGTIEIIKNAKLSEDGKSIIFGSDKFSTYAIAYNDVKDEDKETKPEDTKTDESKPEDTKTEDVKKENVAIGPVTGDDIAIYVVSLIISIMGIIVLGKLNVSRKN